MLNGLLSRVDRLCTYDHCRVPLPWFIWNGRADPASRLHRLALELEYGRPFGSVGHARTLLAALIHFVRGTRELVMSWSRQSAACHQGYGVARHRQLVPLFVAVFRYNFPPSLFYRTRLFKLERARWISMFSHGETTAVLSGLERAASAHNHLWTKSGWATFCAGQHMATPPIAAIARDGVLTILGAGLLSPGRDLFLKPDRDYSGRGGVMLEWDASAHGWHAIGAVTAFIPGETLMEFLRNHSRQTTVVVQPRLRNAPALADLATRALVNTRIVTLRAADGTVSVLMAALRLPPGDQPTSDVVGGTLACAIDLNTGALGPAECARLELGPCVRHPVSAAPIQNRVLPEWPQMRAQALAAHRLVPCLPAIGWDLVATPEGTFILEANSVWNGNLAQQWGRAPLGETPWPELMLAAHATTGDHPPAA